PLNLASASLSTLNLMPESVSPIGSSLPLLDLPRRPYFARPRDTRSSHSERAPLSLPSVLSPPPQDSGTMRDTSERPGLSVGMVFASRSASEGEITPMFLSTPSALSTLPRSTSYAPVTSPLLAPKPDSAPFSSRSLIIASSAGSAPARAASSRRDFSRVVLSLAIGFHTDMSPTSVPSNGASAVLSL